IKQQLPLLVSVDFATQDGTAGGRADYEENSGSVTLAPGETSKEIVLQVMGDRLNEPDETFFVQLGNPKFATIARDRATGTILNDDPLPSASIDDVTLTEGDNGTKDFTFVVTLSEPSGQQITVDYSTLDGGAVAGRDYEPVHGTLRVA